VVWGQVFGLGFDDGNGNGLGVRVHLDAKGVVGAAFGGLTCNSVDDVDGPGGFLTFDVLFGPSAQIESGVDELGPCIRFPKPHNAPFRRQSVALHGCSWPASPYGRVDCSLCHASAFAGFNLRCLIVRPIHLPHRRQQVTYFLSRAMRSAERSPCFVAFILDRALPAAVRGPVLHRHGLWLCAACCNEISPFGVRR